MLWPVGEMESTEVSKEPQKPVAFGNGGSPVNAKMGTHGWVVGHY